MKAFGVLVPMAFCFGKNRALAEQPKPRLRSGYCMIPHPDKAHKMGEDACYCDDELLVVLDGVGGWNEVGVDPGLFSKQLVALIQEQDRRQDLKSVLVEAVKQTTVKGSSTAVLARLDDGVLKTCNLGDSGYAVFGVKGGKQVQLKFRSKEQQYEFDFPFQCGTNCDLPYEAQDNEHVLEPNDLIVLGSDGLFDNLYDEDVRVCLAPLVDRRYGDVQDPTQAAVCIARKAQRLSRDPAYFSPFAKAAKEHGKHHEGGKVDDITVVVA